MVGGCHCVTPKSLRRVKKEGSGFVRSGDWRHLVPSSCALTLHPQAELAASHKCLSHEVKRLTEENQGLRAEQPQSSAPRVLEQEGQEESMPSSVPVRGVQAPGAWGSPWWYFLPVDWGTDPGCCVLTASPWPTHLTFLRLFPHLKMVPSPLASIGMKRK